MATIGIFPFGGPGNPYTEMLAEGIVSAGYAARPLQDTKFFPLRRAACSGVDALHLLWPGNLYHSSSLPGTWLKQLMFADGLRCLSRMPASYSADNLFPHDSADIPHEISMIQRIVDSVRAVSVASAAGERLFRATYRLGPDAPIFRVPHRHYIGKYPDTVTKIQARNTLGLPANARVVLSLGRITPYKGLPELVRGFSQVDLPDTLLLVAGSEKKPGAAAAITAAAAKYGCLDSLRLDARFIPEQEIQNYLRAADVMALSYEDVPMNPGSVILAMSFGLPVVCVEDGSVPEILGEALYGFSRSDDASLVSALHRALCDTGELARKGLVARARAEANHSPEIVAASLRALFKHVTR